MKPRVEHKPVNGTDVTKRAELQLRTINVHDELQTSNSEENIQNVWKVIRSNRRLGVREVAEEGGL